MKTYWLDTNVYIQAANGPYSFDLAPTFWTFLSKQLTRGTLKSPKMVFDEVVDYDDYLQIWCRQRRKHHLGVTATRAVQEQYGHIADYVYSKHARRHADEFCSKADGWVIAHALAAEGQNVVVTHETEKSAKGKVKIPRVCDAFGMKWINLYQMLTELKFRF